MIGGGNRDREYNIRETADSVEDAREAIRRLLSGETWTPEDAEEIGGEQTEPAYPALLREACDGDIARALLHRAGEGIAFRCDDGTLTVARDRYRMGGPASPIPRGAIHAGHCSGRLDVLLEKAFCSAARDRWHWLHNVVTFG